jgi:broad specificity phosphatase PhoE
MVLARRKMVKIILIRHGETDWNKEQVFRGRIDVPLNQTGLAQAHAVRETLAEIAIDALYASPLARAFETARVLAEDRNLDITAEEGLSDVDFGLWQGVAKEQVEKNYPDLYSTWLTDPQLVTFPRGETLLKVQKRSMAALERAMDSNRGKTIAVVSHRVVNKVILCAVLGLDLSRFWHVKQDTCAINRFEQRDGGYYLTLLNDTCHLRDIAGATVLDF